MKISRAAFLVSSTSIATSAFIPAVVRANAPIRIGATASLAAAQVFYARELGMFARSGLDVDVEILASGGVVAEAIAGGSLELGIVDSVTLAAAHSRGVPLVFVAPATIFTKKNPSYVLMVAADSPIKTARDLNGKTIAVNSIRNILQIPTQAWIDNNGGDSTSIKWIELSLAAMGTALINGNIDGASVAEPFITNNLDTGKVRMISIAQKGIAPEFLFSGWAAKRDWVERNPEAAKKLVAVFADAARWGNANPGPSSDIVVKVTKMPSDIASRLIRTYYGEHVDVKLLQPVIDAAAKYGAIPAAFPAGEVYGIPSLRG
jgi:NitT/TauT family transport system substrate-binding protein